MGFFVLVVFSKSHSPYCRASKVLFNGMGASYFVIELDKVGELMIALRLHVPILTIERTAPKSKTLSKA